jgi:hypothetical protein
MAQWRFTPGMPSRWGFSTPSMMAGSLILAFVVDDDVEAAGVLRIAVDGELRARGVGLAVGADLVIGGVDDFDADVGALLEALFQDVLLRGVVVAAAAGDEEDFQRRGCVGGNCGGAEYDGDGECERGGAFHDWECSGFDSRMAVVLGRESADGNTRTRGPRNTRKTRRMPAGMTMTPRTSVNASVTSVVSSWLRPSPISKLPRVTG